MHMQSCCFANPILSILAFLTSLLPSLLWLLKFPRQRDSEFYSNNNYTVAQKLDESKSQDHYEE